MNKKITMDIFRKVFNIIIPYWKSEEKLKAISLLVTAILLSLGQVWASVRMNYWTKDIYNALEKKSYDAFIKQIYIFIGILAILIVVFVTKYFVTEWLTFSWRQWLTNRYLKRWTKNHVYYQASINKGKIDNPDQRISNDAYTVPATFIGLTLTAILEIVSLVSFCKILWDISSTFTITTFGTNYSASGYLAIIALLYSSAGTFFAVKVGKPLIDLSFLQEKYEANFRFSLIRLQEKSEEIALFNGVEEEKKYLREKFSNIRSNFFNIVIRYFYINIYNNFYFNLNQLIPLVAISPMYFSGLITLGVLMQVKSAFMSVINSLSIIVQQFPSIASWKASVNRLADFEEFLTTHQQIHQASEIIRRKDGHDLVIQDLSVSLPNGRKILDNLNLHFINGEKYLITGESGIGKSTLIKALAGVWILGKGKINLPKEEIDFFSQRPYMPISSLRKSIFYPLNANQKQNKKLVELLDKFKLSHLKPLLDENKDFMKLLSLGEQQRIAIIRAILHKPKWLILDEPTSSVNSEYQEIIFSMLYNELKNSTIITISHNKDALEKFHDHHIDITSWKA